MNFDKLGAGWSAKSSEMVSDKKKIRYGLLPKPHYVAENLTILNGDEEIGLVKNFKAFITINKFLFIDKISNRIHGIAIGHFATFKSYLKKN